MEYMLTFHILNVYVDKTQPHQFKFTFKTLIAYNAYVMNTVIDRGLVNDHKRFNRGNQNQHYKSRVKCVIFFFKSCVCVRVRVFV